MKLLLTQNEPSHFLFGGIYIRKWPIRAGDRRDHDKPCVILYFFQSGIRSCLRHEQLSWPAGHHLRSSSATTFVNFSAELSQLQTRTLPLRHLSSQQPLHWKAQMDLALKWSSRERIKNHVVSVCRWWSQRLDRKCSLIPEEGLRLFSSFSSLDWSLEEIFLATNLNFGSKSWSRLLK